MRTLQDRWGFLQWNGEICEEHKEKRGRGSTSKFSMLFLEVVSLSFGKTRILNKKMDLLSNSSSSGGGGAELCLDPFFLSPSQLIFHPQHTRRKFSSSKTAFNSFGSCSQNPKHRRIEQRGTIPGQPLVCQFLTLCPPPRDFLRHSRGFPARIMLTVSRMNAQRCSGHGQGQGHAQDSSPCPLSLSKERFPPIKR